MTPWVLRNEAAAILGVPYWRLDELRMLGLVPSARAGRLHVFPRDQLAEVRERLIRDGHIRPDARPMPAIAAAAAG